MSDTAAMIGSVPRISAFYGILITMYWLDHPPPHFHAAYAGHVAQIEIESFTVTGRVVASTRVAVGGGMGRIASGRVAGELGSGARA